MAASCRRESFFVKKLIVSLIIAIVVLLNISVVNAAGLSTAALFNTEKLDSGIITISYNTDINAKLKVMIEKNGKKVTYNLNGDGKAESFPLQMGDGDYKVSVLENVEGDKYKYISTENVNLGLKDDNQVYLASVQNINWNSNMIAINKAADLIKGLKTDSQKVDTIYSYLVGNITYDYDKLANLSNEYLPNIDDTVISGKGICYDYASTFAAMLRSQGIPVKLVKGYTTNVTGYHAWNEIYDSETKKWMTVDLTYDAQMKAAKVKYNMEKKTSQYTKVYEY